MFNSSSSNSHPIPPLPSISQNAQETADQKKMWQLMEKTLMAGISEQRRARRWGIFFKLFFIAYIIFITTLIMVPGINTKNDVYDDIDPSFHGGGMLSSGPHTALIRLEGTIADGEDASAEKLNLALRRAFANRNTVAILLQINSGGGSPVQSGYVYDEIKRLRGLYPEKKVYAVITDIGASGAYYIAAAADEIYADKASLVGSIGVTAATFGFVGTLDKLGIERRLYTSGDHKAFLDPFSPMNPTETDFWKGVLGNVHQQFIDVVREGRGERLKENQGVNIFSGLIWDGEHALALGLIDGLGSPTFVARDIIKTPRIQDFTHTDAPLDRFMRRLGSSIAQSLSTQWQGLRLQ